MGISLPTCSSSSYDKTDDRTKAVSGKGFGSTPSKAIETILNTNGNPNPKNYKFVKIQEVLSYIVVMVNYPDCKNYEGNKIMVYECSLVDLINQGSLDPHFSNSETMLSPIARFVPTDEGWNMALRFCKSF